MLFFVKQKTAYEVRISDWSSDVCSSDLAVKEQYAIENALNKISGYGLVNARIAYKLDNPNIEMFIFWRNLTGKKYLVRRFADLYRQIGFAAEYTGDPMNWGSEIGRAYVRTPVPYANLVFCITHEKKNTSRRKLSR